jgi:hypothetical protein
MNDILKKIKAIKVGENYPSFVQVVEDGKTITFNLCSYIAGMYCSSNITGMSTPYQMGDHDNKQVVRALKKDLIAATKRGAVIEIGNLHPIKSMGR